MMTHHTINTFIEFCERVLLLITFGNWNERRPNPSNPEKKESRREFKDSFDSLACGELTEMSQICHSNRLFMSALMALLFFTSFFDVDIFLSRSLPRCVMWFSNLCFAWWSTIELWNRESFSYSPESTRSESELDEFPLSRERPLWINRAWNFARGILKQIPFRIG